MSEDSSKLVDELPANAEEAVSSDEATAAQAPDQSLTAEQLAEEPPQAEAASEPQSEAEPQVDEQADLSAEETEAVEESEEAEAEEESSVPEVEEPSEPEASDSGATDSGATDDEAISMDWYILKVQSNRERSIADALRRKIAIEGLDEFFGDVVVPTEKVTEFKGGKKKVVERKLYPGYIVVNMHINDDTWFAVRETSGIGDFTGSGGKPTPMLPHEVARIIHTEEEETSETPKLNISFELGDRVKIKEGTFESFEGEVNAIDQHSGRITVMINIFGRSTPVELEYWQAEQM